LTYFYEYDSLVGLCYRGRIFSKKEDINMVYFYFVLAYLFILIGIALYKSRIVKTQADFMVAGRRLTAPILVSTLLATWIGAGSITGGAGLGYRQGIAGLWMPAGAWVGMVLIYFIATRIRRFGQFTVPDILEARYNKYARLIGTVTTIIAYTAIASYQFRAGGIILNLVSGISENKGVLLTAIFVIGYTALAGMISIAYTDIVNGAIIILGTIIALPFLINSAGGFSAITSALPASHFQPLGTMNIWKALGYFFPTLFLLLGESNMYQKLFSAKNERHARLAVGGWVIGIIIIESLIIFIAVVGSVLFPNINSESVFLHSARHGVPTLIGCLLLGSAVAVIISTADSFLLVPATNIMRDIYQRFINPDASQKRILIYSRLTVVILGLIAYAQVSIFPTILAMAIYAYTMYGATLTPPTLSAFFWKRATGAGCLSGMIGAAFTTIIWEAMKQPWGIPTIFPAISIAITLLIIISLLTPKPLPEKWQPFFKASEE
jgi:SSS family solute:Na+ symporter